MRKLLLLLFSGFISGAAAQPCTVAISGPTMVCSGFQTTITASGASSYTWKGTNIPPPGTGGSSIVVGPGNYTLVGNTAGCIDSIAFAVGLYQPLMIMISISSLTTCIVSNAPLYSKVVNISAAGAASYVWFASSVQGGMPAFGPSVGVRPAATSCYTVVGSTAVCSGSATVCVSVMPQFSVGLPTSQYTICSGAGLALNVSGASTFSWTEPNGFTTLSSNLSSSVIATPNSNIVYTVQGYDATGCASTERSVSVTVIPCVGIVDHAALQIEVYNDLNGSIVVRSGAEVRCQLLDLAGRSIGTLVHMPSGEHRLEIGSIPKGLYLLRIQTRDDVLFKRVFNFNH
jgi:hypothetical protein